MRHAHCSLPASRLLPSVLLAGLLAAPWTGRAETPAITIRKSAGGECLLDVNGFKSQGGGAADLFRRTLEADLTRSGWFNLIRAGKAEFTVVGVAETAGDKVAVRCEAYHVSTQDRYLGKSYKAAEADARRLAHRVADELVQALIGRPGMAASRIVLVGSRTGKKELYLCDADGQNLRALTRDGTLSLSPKWGPDGNRITYTSYFSQFPDVYLVNLDTGARQCLANFPGLNASAALSPDGREMALILSKDGNPELYVMELSGKRLTRLTRTKAAEASPAWAPDGRRIVYVSDQAGVGMPQLYLIERAGGEPRRLTSRGSQNVDPDWGANGFIAYCSLLGGQFQISVLNPETGDTVTVSPGDASYEDPSWAPDGRHIVCTRSSGYRTRIFVVDATDKTSISLLPDSESGDWSSPDWSP